MSARIAKTENTNGLRALIDELLARKGGGGGGKGGTQYVFVYRPGGVSVENVYTDWPSLMTARSLVQGNAIIEIEGSLAAAHVPAGAWNLDDTILLSAQTSAQGFTLIFDNGATFVFNTLILDGVTCKSESSSAVATVSSLCFVVARQESVTFSDVGAAPFFHVTGTGFLSCIYTQGSTIGSAFQGSPQHVVTVDAGGQFFSYLFSNSELLRNALDPASAGTFTIDVDSTSTVGAIASSLLPQVTIDPLDKSVVDVKQFGAAGDGVTDDTAAIQKAFTVTAAGGMQLHFSEGTYLVTAPIGVPSGAWMVGGANVTINANFASTGNPSNALFASDIQQTNPNNIGTVNATPAFGATVVQVALPHDPTGAFAISVGPGLGQQISNIVSVAAVGGGVYNVTIADPLVQPIQVGDQAFTLASYPTAIHMEGNGTVLTGKCDRMQEFVGAFRCVTSGFRYIGTVGDVAGDAFMSFDIGGRENTFEDCFADMTGSGALVEAFMLEGQIGSIVRRCFAKNAGNRCFIALDCVASGFEDCQAIEGNVGFYFVQDGTARGCFNCWAKNCQAFNCNANGNSFGFGTGLADGVDFDNVIAQNCVTGFITGTGGTSTNIYARRLDVSYSTSLGVSCNSDLFVDGFTAEGISANINIVAVFTASRVKFCNFRIVTTGQGNSFVIAAAGRLYLQDGTVTMNNGAGSANAFVAEPGVLILDRVKAAGARAVGIFLAAANAYCRMGENVDVSGCSTPTASVANTAFNRGTFNSANGATAISFPDLTAQDNVFVTPTAAAATGFVNSTTPGTGFSWTDTGVHSYSYAIL